MDEQQSFSQFLSAAVRLAWAHPIGTLILVLAWAIKSVLEDRFDALVNAMLDKMNIPQRFKKNVLAFVSSPIGVPFAVIAIVLLAAYLRSGGGAVALNLSTDLALVIATVVVLLLFVGLPLILSYVRHHKHPGEPRTCAQDVGVQSCGHEVNVGNERTGQGSVSFHLDRYYLQIGDPQAQRENAIRAGVSVENIPQYLLTIDIGGRFTNRAGHDLEVLSFDVALYGQQPDGISRMMGTPEREQTVILVDATGGQRLGSLDRLVIPGGRSSDGEYRIRSLLPLTRAQRRRMDEQQHYVRVTIECPDGTTALETPIDMSALREFGHTTEHEPFF